MVTCLWTTVERETPLDTGEVSCDLMVTSVYIFGVVSDVVFPTRLSI